MRSELNTVLAERFRLKKRIGGGGQGEVFLAEDLKYGDHCAVKRVRSTDRAGENEGRLLSAIRHPAIPRLRSEFCIGGCRYLCMDYIRGKTLKELLHERTFSEKEARQIALSLLDILSYLHHLCPKVLYLDLKPSNILVDENQRLWLIDFGIARRCNGKETRKIPVSALTRGYAAPEQYLSAAGMDERTDLYALGVILHYLLTRKNPNEPPFSFESVRRINPHVSRGMEELIKKLLQPDPKLRFQSAEEVTAVLKTRSKKQFDRRKALLTGAALVAALGIGKTLFSPETPKETTSAETKALSEEEGAEELTEATELRLVPEGGTYETFQLVRVEYPMGKGYVHYTLDGSAPTKESPLYTDGIVVSAPETRLRACLIDPYGECEEVGGTYRITAEIKEVEADLKDPVMWDIYYTLKKQWQEPLYNFELATLRELPEGAEEKEYAWLRDYLPFLREEK